MACIDVPLTNYRMHDCDPLWSDVEIASASSGRLVARGTVIYRIVT